MAKSSKPLSRSVRFLLIGFIASCTVFTVGLVALKIQPGLAIIPFVAKERTSPYCSVWRGVTDANVKLTQADLEQKLLA